MAACILRRSRRPGAWRRISPPTGSTPTTPGAPLPAVAPSRGSGTGRVGGCEKPRINGEHKIWGLTSGDDVFSQIGRLVAGSSLPAMNTRCVRTLGRVTRRAGAQRGAAKRLDARQRPDARPYILWFQPPLCSPLMRGSTPPLTGRAPNPSPPRTGAPDWRLRAAPAVPHVARLTVHPRRPRSTARERAYAHAEFADRADSRLESGSGRRQVGIPGSVIDAAYLALPVPAALTAGDGILSAWFNPTSPTQRQKGDRPLIFRS